VRSTKSVVVLVAQLVLPVLAALIVVPFVKPHGTLWPWAPSTVDLDVYQYTGHIVLSGGSILIDRAPIDAIGDQLAFIYPPFAALLCVPLVVVPHVLLQILMTAANALAVLAVLHRMGLKGWVLSLMGTGCVLLVEPIRETIGFGQINTLLMTLVVLDLVPGPRVLPGKPVLPKGVLTGLAAAIKVTPGLFAIQLLFARKWRAAWGVILTAGVATVGTALFRWDESIGFFRLLLEGDTRTGSTWFLFNQSVLAGMLRLNGDNPTSYQLGIALSAVVALAGAFAAALWLRRGQPLLAVALCGTATLMASPLSWTHHFVWVVPLGGALILGKDLPRALRVVGLAYSVWVATAFYKFLSGGTRFELTYNLPELIISDLTPMLGILLIVVALVQARRVRTVAEQPEPERVSAV
jgi:alpha-1,2-mannosyltransferase